MSTCRSTSPDAGLGEEPRARAIRLVCMLMGATALTAVPIGLILPIASRWYSNVGTRDVRSVFWWARLPQWFEHAWPVLLLVAMLVLRAHPGMRRSRARRLATGLLAFAGAAPLFLVALVALPGFKEWLQDQPEAFLQVLAIGLGLEHGVRVVRLILMAALVKVAIDVNRTFAGRLISRKLMWLLALAMMIAVLGQTILRQAWSAGTISWDSYATCATPLWGAHMLSLLMTGIVLLWCSRRARRAPLAVAVCACGYDLSGSEGARCPECGVGR